MNDTNTDNVEEIEVQTNEKVEETEVQEQEESKEETEVQVKSDEEKAADKTQRRIDRLTWERAQEKAKAEYLEKELARFKEQPKQEVHGEETEHDRIKRLVQEQLKFEREAEVQQKQKQVIDAQVEKWMSSVEEAKNTKYEDWDEVVKGNTAHCSPAMIDAILDDANGTDITYYLGKHPDEAEKIYELSPVKQVKEIAKLGLKFSEPVKTKTTAPAPLKPVAASKAAGGLRDDLPYDEWEKIRNETSKIK